MLTKKALLYIQFPLTFRRLCGSNTCQVVWDPQASSIKSIYKYKWKAFWLQGNILLQGGGYCWLAVWQGGFKNWRLHIRGLSQGDPDSSNSAAWLSYWLVVYLWKFEESAFGFLFLVVVSCLVLYPGTGSSKMFRFGLDFSKELAYAFPPSPCSCPWLPTSIYQNCLLALPTRENACIYMLAFSYSYFFLPSINYDYPE